MKDETLRIAIVGAGYWGPNLVRNFQQIEDCEIAWVCEQSTGRRCFIGQQFPGVPLTAEYEEVLSDSEVDAVVLATPIGTHAALGLAALAAGKHLMVEKPLAGSAGEARRLVEEGERAGLVIATDHLFVYNPAIAKMKELLDTGEAGDRCYATADRANPGPPGATHSVVWDLAVHDLAISYYLWGELPVSVTAQGRSFRHSSLTDAAFIHLEFADGTMALHHASWLSPTKIRKYFLAGRDGSFFFDDRNAGAMLRQVGWGVDTRAGARQEEAKELFYQAGEERVPELDPVQPLEASCRHFLECVRNGKRPRADARAGLAVVRMLEAAELSIRENNRPVALQ